MMAAKQGDSLKPLTSLFGTISRHEVSVVEEATSSHDTVLKEMKAPGVDLANCHGMSVVKKATCTFKKASRSKKASGVPGRAEAILEFLSAGWASEVQIRKALGDTPDTSKALRMLVKVEEVERFGAGGRLNPFLYAVAERHIEVEPNVAEQHVKVEPDEIDQHEESCVVSS